MADVIPNIFIDDQATKNIDFVNDIMKVALLSGTFTESYLRNTSAFDIISDNEIDGKYGYPAGGFTAINKTVTTNSDAERVVYDMDDVGGTVAGGTLGPIRYGVLYNASNSGHLVYIFDFGSDLTVNDGAQFMIRIDSDGLMYGAQGTSI